MMLGMRQGLYTAFYNAVSVKFVYVFALTYLVFYQYTSCIYKASTEEWRQQGQREWFRTKPVSSCCLTLRVAVAVKAERASRRVRQ